MREVEHAEGVGDRYRADRRAECPPDEHWTPAPPIDPRPRAARSGRERGCIARGERADLERGRIERDDRERRKEHELGDRAAHLADRLAQPEQDEVRSRGGSLPDFGHPVSLPK